MIMELIEGIDLSCFVPRRPPLPNVVVLQCGIEIAGALNLMHRNSSPIVHRDLKPGNILFCPARQTFMLTDFGLATTLGHNDPLHEQAKKYARTAFEQYLGTPAYSSPEQLQNAGDIDHRADIWALGATLYALMTGIPPLSRQQTLEAQAGMPVQPQSIRARIPLLPTRVSVTIDRMLAVDPEKRLESASDVATSLLESQSCYCEDELDHWYGQFKTLPSLVKQMEWMKLTRVH